MPRKPAHCDALGHARGEHQLCGELCECRRQLAAAWQERDEARYERDELAEELETARRIIQGYRDDVLRSLPPC
jgi:uncharacterized coiled-coil DUF342 family protein